MKIITLNLRHNQDRWEERFPLVVDTLYQEQSDLIGLQEVWMPIQQAHLIANELNARMPDQPYHVLVEPKRGTESVEGIGILSRLPVLEHGRLELPEGERVAQRIVVEIDGQRVHFANTHLHHRPIEDESIRLPQMRALLDWMFSHSSERWILSGDMNALPESTTIAAAGERLQTAYFAAHGTHPITFPTPLVYHTVPEWRACIDHIFFDPQTLRVTDARVVANQSPANDATLYPSDHYGLAVEFDIIG